MASSGVAGFRSHRAHRAYAFGHVSGGPFNVSEKEGNPALTIGPAVAKRFQWRGVAAYILTQVVAGVAGLALYAIASGTSGFSASESGFASNG